MNDTDRPATWGILTLHGIHTAEALARFAGDEERYRHWLAQFVSYGPETAVQIDLAITGGFPEQAIMLTHGFKGRTGMLGMTELHSIARSLEMTLKNGEPTALWLEELKRTVIETSREIASILGDGEPPMGANPA